LTDLIRRRMSRVLGMGLGRPYQVQR